MKLYYRILAIFLFFFVLSSNSFSDAFVELEKETGVKIEPLPVQRILVMEKNNEIKIVSQNGRFLFERVYDRWNKKYITSMPQAKKILKTINLDNLDFNVDALEPFKFGHGEKQVVFIIDPKCPYCQRLISEMPKDSNKYTFNIVPVGLLGRQSMAITQRLFCAKNKDEARRALVAHDFKKTLEMKETCEQTVLAKRYLAAQVLNITQVPFLIRSDGLVKSGYPEEGLINWLEMK